MASLYWSNTATCCFSNFPKSNNSSSVLPYLPIESSGCIICEKPVFSSKLRQLNLAEVATVSSRDCWYCQQGIWELEEVCITAPEFVSIDLCRVPLEGRDGHIWTCFQDGAPSGEITQRKTFIIPSMKTLVIIFKKKILGVLM